MSTKIYNAYLVMGNTNKMLEVVRTLQDEYRLKAAQKIYKADYTVWNDAAKAFNGSILYYPNSFDLVIIQVFSREIELDSLQAFIKDKTLSDFHYQNQTDPWFDYNKLEGEEYKKAEKDWAFREKVWDEIFSKYWSPAGAGFEMPLLGDINTFPYNIKELIDKEANKDHDNDTSNT